MSERHFGEMPDDWAKRGIRQIAKDWSEPSATPETITISPPALRAVVLGVIDDGDPLLTGLPWQIDRPMPDVANDARLRFCDELERRLRQLPALAERGEGETMIYYHDSELGCGLGEARDLRTAEAEVRREIGSYHAAAGFTVRKATANDIAWVKAMGGWLPERLREKKECVC